MKIPVIMVIVDSEDMIPRKDGLKAEMQEKWSLIKRIQMLLKRNSLNGKGSK